MHWGSHDRRDVYWGIIVAAFPQTRSEWRMVVCEVQVLFLLLVFFVFEFAKKLHFCSNNRLLSFLCRFLLVLIEKKVFTKSLTQFPAIDLRRSMNRACICLSCWRRITLMNLLLFFRWQNKSWKFPTLLLRFAHTIVLIPGLFTRLRCTNRLRTVTWQRTKQNLISMRWK